MPRSKRPSNAASCCIFARRGDTHQLWLAIGATFMHQDGDGMTVAPQALPLDGKIVLRLPKEKGEETVAPRPANEKRRESRK